jgi:hypothetical protein
MTEERDSHWLSTIRLPTMPRVKWEEIVQITW